MPRALRHAFNEGRYAQPPLRSLPASIKRTGAEQSGPDPIRPAASTGVLGSLFPISRRHGRSRLSNPSTEGSNVLGLRSRQELECSRLYLRSA